MVRCRRFNESKDSLVLIKQQIKNVDSVIIGSRFVDGGAYKGTLLNENKLFNTLRNLNIPRTHL